MNNDDRPPEDRVFDRIVSDPERLGGVPCIRGTRIPADMVAALVEDGVAIDEILTDYPQLEREDIEQAVAFVRARR